MTEKEYIEGLFRDLPHNPGKFFEKVAENVRWTVMGTHPLAGEYLSKEDFLDSTFRRLNRVLRGGPMLEVDSILVDGEYCAVELRSLSTAKNGKPFNNTHCWIVKFEGDMITEVRTYFDSALVRELLEENEQGDRPAPPFGP